MLVKVVTPEGKVNVELSFIYTACSVSTSVKLTVRYFQTELGALLKLETPRVGEQALLGHKSDAA
jgi:hypothetical protein